VDTQNPYLRINLHISNDQVNLSFNTSGDSLHKRGYREIVDKAPINEVLAAGLIKLSGWKADSHFVDSMCGSATIPIEAAMMGMNIPAGYYRKSYGFMNWTDFEPELWKAVMNEADGMICEFDHEIIGSDRSLKAIEIARQNVRKAHLHKDIRIIRKNMEEFAPPQPSGFLIINPPYGERLEEKDIKALYSSIGDSLKRNFSGYRAWIISSDFYALKHVGLKSAKKLTVYNGPLECRFVCYDIFAGSHKEMKRIEGIQSSFSGKNSDK
jgi:putative N6-adenine-specific DNA methylase